MAKTRATKAAPASKPTDDSKTQQSKHNLSPQSENPSKLFILPTKASPGAQIVTLPNPRHARPARYLVCPETGIYEFTRVSAPKTTPRSWLIETRPHTATEDTKDDSVDAKAEVSMGAELFLATAIDPVFLVVPALADVKASKGSDEQKRLFLSSEDHFDHLPTESSHLSEILRCEKTRKLIERRMGAICDTVDAGDDSMFRLNEGKLVTVVLEKAKRMSKGGLPQSMEDKFVRKALEAPIRIQKRVMNTSQGIPITENAESQGSTPKTESNESQSTVASAETTDTADSQPSTTATSFTEEPTASDGIFSAISASAEIFELQRLRVAFSFICSSYIAPTLATKLEDSLAKLETSSINFTPLNEYLAELAKLRAEAVSARSVGDYRKHGRDEEDDEVRAEKKRKLEEEKRRKASQSRGVRDLKKVNTAGMKKMSDFFKKK
ncbi:hypothetical protein G7046_g8242 [Stylonectria norvegica]|nr:hypothetical protein G7046_g8242 [Stylonectria norvegica]